MPRTFVRDSPPRTVTVADPAFPASVPAAPKSSVYTEVSPLPIGVFRTEGANVVLVDIAQGTASTANTYNVVAWNSFAQQWFSVVVISTAAGLQQVRTSVPNWASDYCFVVVSGVTVSATIAVSAAEVITS